MQTDTTTSNIGGPTMLGVVGSVVTVVCKQMQQLPTICGPAVNQLWEGYNPKDFGGHV